MSYCPTLAFSFVGVDGLYRAVSILQIRRTVQQRLRPQEGLDPSQWEVSSDRQRIDRDPKALQTLLKNAQICRWSRACRMPGLRVACPGLRLMA